MRYLGSGTPMDPCIDDETDFDELSQDELLQLQIEEHLAFEEHLLEEIIEADAQRID